MVLKYTNKTNFILLDGFARGCTVSVNFPDNPRTLVILDVLFHLQLEVRIVLIQHVSFATRHSSLQTLSC